LTGSGTTVATDIEQTQFNELFNACPVVKYTRNGGVHSVYVRRAGRAEVDAFSLFTYLWASSNNVLGTDFDIYSSEADARSGTGAWTFCNYDDPDVGYPRDCGASGAVGNQWFTMPSAGQHDANSGGGAQRFDIRGISSGASFEIYTGADCPAPVQTGPEDQCNGRYEAEVAVMNGAVFDSGNDAHEGFTGSGFIDYLNPTGDYIEWSLPSCSGGEATLHFRYALAGADRPLQVLLNGVEVAASLSFPPTGSWARYTRTALTVTLIPGANTVRLVATGVSGANTDSLLVLSGTPSYYIATYGDAACPSGKDVMTYAECETAHNQLELEIDPVWTGDNSGIPSMCSTREHNWGGQHHFHWDTSGVGTGVSRADLAPVCRV